MNQAIRCRDFANTFEQLYPIAYRSNGAGGLREHVWNGRNKKDHKSAELRQSRCDHRPVRQRVASRRVAAVMSMSAISNPSNRRAGSKAASHRDG